MIVQRTELVHLKQEQDGMQFYENIDAMIHTFFSPYEVATLLGRTSSQTAKSLNDTLNKKYPALTQYFGQSHDKIVNKLCYMFDRSMTAAMMSTANYLGIPINQSDSRDPLHGSKIVKKFNDILDSVTDINHEFAYNVFLREVEAHWVGVVGIDNMKIFSSELASTNLWQEVSSGKGLQFETLSADNLRERALGAYIDKYSHDLPSSTVE